MTIQDAYATIVDGDQLNDGYFNDVKNRLPPIGSVQSWLKTYTNTPTLPDGWVECSGQTLSDANSVYDGQVIPNLNGNNQILKGESTSGGTNGGAHTHTYVISSSTFDTGSSNGVDGTGTDYYNVVWIMRIK